MSSLKKGQLNHRDTEGTEDFMFKLCKTLCSPCLRGELIWQSRPFFRRVISKSSSAKERSGARGSQSRYHPHPANPFRVLRDPNSPRSTPRRALPCVAGARRLGPTIPNAPAHIKWPGYESPACANADAESPDGHAHSRTLAYAEETRQRTR